MQLYTLQMSSYTPPVMTFRQQLSKTQLMGYVADMRASTRQRAGSQDRGQVADREQVADRGQVADKGTGSQDRDRKQI